MCTNGLLSHTDGVFAHYREYLDHLPFWNARYLRRKLLQFEKYYNRDCVHRRLGGTIPNPRAPRQLDKLLAWIITARRSAAVACTSYPSPLDYKFATHRAKSEVNDCSITENFRKMAFVHLILYRFISGMEGWTTSSLLTGYK